MAYSPQTWTNGAAGLTPLSAARLTHMEDGIAAAVPVFNAASTYGAVGDNSTDDTTAIQAALTAAGAVGGIAYLPPGTYKVTSTLTLPQRAGLVGAGWQAFSQSTYGAAAWNTVPSTIYGGTTLRSTVTSGSAVFGDHAVAARWMLRDFALVGPGSGTSVGIRLADTGSFNTRPNVTNVGVFNFATGLKVGTTNHARFDSFTAYACATGVDLGPQFNDNVFLNLEVQQATVDGIVIATSSGNQFLGGVIQSCSGTAGLRVASSTELNTFQGFWAEAVTATNTALLGGGAVLRDWKVASDSSGIRATVSGCSFEKITGTALTITLDSGTRQHLVKQCSISALSANGAGYVRMVDNDQVVVAPFSGQTNDLLVLKDASGNTVSKFDKDGILQSAVDIKTTVAGKGLFIKEGTNARGGFAILVGGTVTVPTTAVTANSRIQVTSNIDGGIPGFLRVSSRSAGTSFTVTSSSATDTSVIAWLIVEPA